MDMAWNSLMQLNHSVRLRRCSSIVVAVACWLVFAPLAAHADPLDLTTNSPGDITSFSYDVEYTPGVSGNPGTLTADSTNDGNNYAVIDDNGYFYPEIIAVTASLDASGNLLGGSLTVDGTEYYTVDGSPLINGGNDTVLLTGSLTAFGFPDPTDSTNVPLEFEFAVTGGALTAEGEPYYSATDRRHDSAHVQRHSRYFTGAWPTSSFSNGPSNNVLNTSADTFPMSYAQTPEPSTFVLLAMGLLPLALRLRRRG